MPRASTSTVPPELDRYVATKKLKALQDRQRDAVLKVLSSGALSAEEAGTAVNQLADGTFSCKYLGSVPVAAAKLSRAMWTMFGDEVISTAHPRIKALKRKAVDVQLCCSTLGIRVFETGNDGGLIEDEPIEQVEYVGVDSTDRKRFAYITHYSRLGLLFCHMFLKAKNDDVVGALNRVLETKRAETEALAPAGLAADAAAEKTTGATVGIFEVLFMGSVPLKRFKIKASDAEGAREHNLAQYHTAAKFAMKELGHESKSGAGGKEDRLKKTPVVLVVSSEGIRVVETGSREMMARVFIEDIEFTTEIVPGGKKSKGLRLFALIVREKRSNNAWRRVCLTLGCSPGEAAQICDSLGVAKEQNCEDDRARAGNPFLASTKLTEPVPRGLEPLEVPRKGLTPEVVLGAGEFGQVFLATQELADGTSRKCAVKMLRGGAASSDKELFCREVAINAELQHANIVGVIGTCMSSRPYLVVLELCRYGDLHGLLQACHAKRFEVTPAEQLSWAVQLASALEYMAQRRFVHLDIAARNTFVDAGHRLRLGDFGLARPFDKGKPYYLMKESTRLSIRWLAVEVCGPPPKLVSAAVDVWAFGVTLWEIVTYARRRPFHRHSLKEAARLVARGARLPKPARGCSAELYAIMQRCWLAEPTDRPTAATLVKELTAMMRDAGGDIRDVGGVLVESEGGDGGGGDGGGGGGGGGGAAEEQGGGSRAAAALGATGRDSVSLNKTEWDELEKLLDAFDN